jgi:hypothetical protein
MKKALICFTFFLFYTHFSIADQIYTLINSGDGRFRPGIPVLSLPENENPGLALADCLGINPVSIRDEGKITYISAKKGPGFIPVLAFHKLGEGESMELTLSRFENILRFLQTNNFHIISDLQFLTGDFTYAPSGSSLAVLGSDDGSSGVFYYKTESDVKRSSFLMDKGRYIISEDCMVYYLNKYLPQEKGKRNFTFYLTFDAIPFRQTGGGYNPGPPYMNMPAVRSKLQYLNDHYYLGNHTLHHYFSEEVSELEYLFELIGYYDVLDSYGIKSKGTTTFAYSYGIGELTRERQITMKNFDYNGITIGGAFDYNGEFARPVDTGETNIYDISRVGVDNGNFHEVMERLEETKLYKTKRAVLVKVSDYPFGISKLTLNELDQNFILIGE